LPSAACTVAGIDAMTIARQMRDCRLKSIEAIIQRVALHIRQSRNPMAAFGPVLRSSTVARLRRQQRVPPERDDDCLLFFTENGRPRRPRPKLAIAVLLLGLRAWSWRCRDVFGP
jgi:hypothetical protein